MIISIVSALAISIGVSYPDIADYFSDGPRAESGFSALMAITLILVIYFVLYFGLLRSPLKVTINREGIHYSCFPFLRSTKTLQWKDVKSIQVVKVDPISDFGGYGYRMVPKKRKGFIMNGEQALEIERADMNIPYYLTIDDGVMANKAIEHYFKGEQK